MTERPDTSDFEDEVTQKLSDRRQLLRLGAAGLPMVLTLKASAQQAVISQLQCIIKMPLRLRFLVDCDGAVWVGTRFIRYENGKGWKVSHITRFKNNASQIFPAGAAASAFRPVDCPAVVCDDDDDDGGKNNDGDYTGGGNGLSELDRLLNSGVPSNASEIASYSNSRSKDDDDDDDCDPDWQDSGYAFYQINKNTEITPGEIINGTGSANNEAQALFVSLSVKYSQDLEGQSSWPGISCIVSILNYLNP